MRRIKFTFTEPYCDRKHFLTEADVKVVLERLPEEAWNKLRAIHFNDRSWGARTLGYANPSEHEIAICALPPRLSLTRFLVRGQSPEQFGAVRGKQWPEVAVRRFLLYDVFLHELGHLQLINEGAKSGRRKFAREKLAQEFADKWRRWLWSRRFEHPDPAHNPPES
jgi:hypothetical protein